MGKVSSVALQLIRLTGLLLIILGVLFWTGHARALVPVHMLLGLIFVVCLWIVGAAAARAGLGTGALLLALVTGLAVLALGLTQRQLLPGSGHVVIRVLHLLLGLGAMGLGEALAARARRTTATDPRPAV